MNLSDIYGTRLHFSGVESRRLLDTFKEFHVPFIQVSFYYLRRVFGDASEAELFLKAFDEVIIDHGLIYHKFKSEPEKKEFLEAYYDYVRLIDPKVYSAVVAHLDLSLDKVIDEDKLIYPMEDLEELFDGDMKSIFSNIEYVGISNKVVQQEDRMNAICSQASKHGTKLHAFGTASQQVLKRWPIYTANTSSWRTGSRYANTYLYEGPGRGLRLSQPTDKSDLAKTEREKNNIRTRQKHLVETRQSELFGLINWESLIDDDDSWEVDKGNLTQWLLYQNDLSLEGKNAYWLTEDEKKELADRKKGDTPATQSERREEVVEGEVVSQEVVKHAGRLREVDPRLLQLRQCDSCILANRCPKYEAGASCAFGIKDPYDIEKLDDHVKENITDLLQIQMDRIQQGYLEEKADGAGLSKDVNREIKTYGELYALYRQATDTRDEITMKAKGTGLLNMFNQNKK